jgi:hypothetical protein
MVPPVVQKKVLGSVQDPVTVGADPFDVQV